LRSFAHAPVTVTAPSANIDTMITSWHNPPPPVNIQVSNTSSSAVDGVRARVERSTTASIIWNPKTRSYGRRSTRCAQLQQVQQLLLQPAKLAYAPANGE
uniref:Uncharacterized protein n=1 Tax=Pristionchus pacificus TaxID=54126 RepID=A0A2A6BIQ6_PRIPA